MSHVEGLIGAAVAGELEASVPPSADAGKTWMEQMADVALADGLIESSERSILLQLGEILGMEPEDVDLLISKRRSHRNQESKLIFPGATGRRPLRPRTLD